MEEVLKHNNYKLRDLRNNRMHPIVHVSRLRRFRGGAELPDHMFVVDYFLDVRRVSVAQARGNSRLEFLVKWRQCPRSQSTWEPLEALEESMEEEVQQYLQQHASHPAIRSWQGRGRVAHMLAPSV